MAQAVHAAFSFAHQFPDTTGQWISESNYLVICSVDSESKLRQLAVEGGRRGIRGALVTEPDLWHEATAVAIGPGIDAQKLCANLPLALKMTACLEVFDDTDGNKSVRTRREGVHV